MERDIKRATKSIQIQHLLKLNLNAHDVSTIKFNSNTTLVKVKLKKVPSP